MTVRDQLVAAGVELLETGGLGHLSQRQIARHAGVSHGAPRHHFATFDGLLAAIAREGVHDLDRAIRPHLLEAEASTALMQACMAVVDFAVSRPAMFELIARHDLLDGAGGDLRATTSTWLIAITGRLREMHPEAEFTQALALWAGVQGLGTMFGRRGVQAITAQAVEPRHVVAALLDGLTGTAAQPTLDASTQR